MLLEPVALPLDEPVRGVDDSLLSAELDPIELLDPDGWLPDPPIPASITEGLPMEVRLPAAVPDPEALEPLVPPNDPGALRFGEPAPPVPFSSQAK